MLNKLAQLADAKKAFPQRASRCRWSVSASGGVTSVLSFGRLTQTGPEFADYGRSLRE